MSAVLNVDGGCTNKVEEDTQSGCGLHFPFFVAIRIRHTHKKITRLHMCLCVCVSAAAVCNRS